MPSFGLRSTRLLKELHPDLQKVMREAIKHYDFSIICGYRGEREQNKAYAEKRSTLKFPRSRHNTYPSQACDCCPYPLDWNDILEFKIMGEAILAAAKTVGVEIEWGGNWLTFKDYPHFQLRR